MLNFPTAARDGEEAVVEWRNNDHTYGSRHYVDAARKNGTLKQIKAMILVDMIGDRDLVLKRETTSTAWLTDIIWPAAKALGHGSTFVAEPFAVEDDHVPFLNARVPAVDLIDLDYAAWHTRGDTVDQTSADSLQVVGDVLLEALPQIEARLATARRAEISAGVSNPRFGGLPPESQLPGARAWRSSRG